MNDLCFFRSLSKLVQEHEREIEHSAANKDKFWNLIVEQYHEFHSRETLERCWDVKTAVTKCILDANRTNNYKLPHGTKHEEAVSDDISSDLDDTDDPVARTLDYEGLHASLPSPSINLWHKLRPPRFALNPKKKKKNAKKTPREFTNHESSQKCLQGGRFKDLPPSLGNLPFNLGQLSQPTVRRRSRDTSLSCAKFATASTRRDEVYLRARFETALANRTLPTPYPGREVDGVMSGSRVVPAASPASRKYRALALIVLTIQNTTLVLVTKFSYRQTALPYVVASTVIASAELVKLLLCCVLLVARDGHRSH